MGGATLDWTSKEWDGARIVAPVGRVDESTATEFGERLGEAAERGGRLIVDLAGIAYMSSRGLRALTLAQRKGAQAGTTIVLARPNATMREILAISRYDMIYRIADTIDEALSG